MEQIDKIFLGNTPNEQRKYLLNLLQRLKKIYSKIYVPCVGQFALVKLCIEAGYQPKDIYTSDISLFSSILGFLYSGKKISKLPKLKLSDSIKKKVTVAETDVEKAAILLVEMKIRQLKSDKFYKIEYQNHYKKNKRRYVKKLTGQLKQYIKYYHNLNYDLVDMRTVLNGEYGKDDLILVNPPAYTNGYAKMFNFGDDIEWNIEIEEWNWNKEYATDYMKSRKGKAGFIWYRYQNVDGLPTKDVVFAREYTKKRHDYWLFTKPANIKKVGYQKYVHYKKPEDMTPLRGMKIVPKDFKIESNTRIMFKQVSQGTALYYRDLWAHKLGNTKAECYYIMLLDSMIFGIVGFHLGEIRRMISDEIFEVFGFNTPLKKYPNANRLLMMAITCREFTTYLYNMQKTNRFLEINSFKTTCLSKYRKVKLNNGLLKIRTKEKLPTGMYRLVYICDIYEKSYEKVVNDYLAELK